MKLFLFLLAAVAVLADVRFTSDIRGLVYNEAYNITWTTDADSVDIYLGMPASGSYEGRSMIIGTDITAKYVLWTPSLLDNGTYKLTANDSNGASATTASFVVAGDTITLPANSAPSESANTKTSGLTPPQIAGIAIAVAGAALLVVALFYLRRWRHAVHALEDVAKGNGEGNKRYPLGTLPKTASPEDIKQHISAPIPIQSPVPSPPTYTRAVSPRPASSYYPASEEFGHTQQHSRRTSIAESLTQVLAPGQLGGTLQVPTVSLGRRSSTKRYSYGYAPTENKNEGDYGPGRGPYTGDWV